LEILASFEDEHEKLVRLALLIAGDIEAADQSVRNAQEMATHSGCPLPLRGQLTEWVKWMTIKSAIACSHHEIVPCAPKYFNQTCTHSEHLLNGNDSKLQEFSNFLSRANPEMVIAELDPLARAVAVLRTTARASILDCTLKLKLSPDTVLAANCRAMTWIVQKRNRADAGEAPQQCTRRNHDQSNNNCPPVRKWGDRTSSPGCK
jgi:hypothetical protein